MLIGSLSLFFLRAQPFSCFQFPRWQAIVAVSLIGVWWAWTQVWPQRRLKYQSHRFGLLLFWFSHDLGSVWCDCWPTALVVAAWRSLG